MNLSGEKCDGNCGLIRGCATHPVPNLITAAPELAAKTDLRVPKAPQQYLRLRCLDEENVKVRVSFLSVHFSFISALFFMAKRRVDSAI